MHQNNRMQSLTLCIVDSLTCSAADTPVVVVHCEQTTCVINKILISQLIACQRQLSGYPDDYPFLTHTGFAHRFPWFLLKSRQNLW